MTDEKFPIGLSPDAVNRLYALAEEQRQRLAELESERDAAYRALMKSWPDEPGLGCDDDVQEMLVGLGLIEAQPADPKNCHNPDCICDPGADCYHPTDKMLRAWKAEP